MEPKSADAGAKEVRRTQLLDIATDLFATRGYHATSISDIIEGAGVARGTFYNYFESKRHIFGTILDQLFERVTSVVFPITKSGAPDEVRSGIRGNILGLCRALSENIPMTRLILEQAVGLDAEANEQLRVFYRKVLDRLEGAILEGQAMGVVRDGNAPVLATCLLGMIKEPLYQQILGTTPEPDLEDLVNEILGVAVMGILSLGPVA